MALDDVVGGDVIAASTWGYCARYCGVRSDNNPAEFTREAINAGNPGYRASRGAQD
jgi:hypothetical protein